MDVKAARTRLACDVKVARTRLAYDVKVARTRLACDVKAARIILWTRVLEVSAMVLEKRENEEREFNEGERTN